jgi:hypothetical protein
MNASGISPAPTRVAVSVPPERTCRLADKIFTFFLAVQVEHGGYYHVVIAISCELPFPFRVQQIGVTPRQILLGDELGVIGNRMYGGIDIGPESLFVLEAGIERLALGRIEFHQQFVVLQRVQNGAFRQDRIG